MAYTEGRQNRALPPPLPSGKTPHYAAPYTSLGDFERSIRAESFEIGAAFSTQGKLALWPRRGGTDEVDFAESEAPLLRNTIVTHNHPTGFPLSGGDGELACERDVAELRAVCPNGVCFVIKRPEGGWPGSDKIMEAAYTARVAIRQEAIERQSRGRADATDEENIEVAIEAQRKAFSDIGVPFVVTNVWEEP